MIPVTTEQLELYRTAIEQQICTICNDRNRQGECTRPEADACALHMHLRLVVDAILSVGESPDVEGYLAALRARTCPHCHQDADGACALREAGECAPDAYILPVIEVIEDVAKTHGHGKWAR